RRDHITIAELELVRDRIAVVGERLPVDLSQEHGFRGVDGADAQRATRAGCSPGFTASGGGKGQGDHQDQDHPAPVTQRHRSPLSRGPTSEPTDSSMTATFNAAPRIRRASSTLVRGTLFEVRLVRIDAGGGG